jgi:hypothetical protein
VGRGRHRPVPHRADARAGDPEEGVQQLADMGIAFTMDVGEGWWLDVDDPRAHRLAEDHFGARLRDISA